MKLQISAIFSFLLFSIGASANSYSTCLVNYTGNYYYVAKDGQRYGDLLPTVHQAIQLQQQLQNAGICQWTYTSPGMCSLEYTGNYYYVARNGSRISELKTNYREALQTEGTLYNSGNCDRASYNSQLVCSVDYTGNYYYVSRNGSRFSELVANLNQVLNMQSDLAYGRACQIGYPTDSCRMEYTGNYYYVSLRGKRFSELAPNLNQALMSQQSLSSNNVCQRPRPESCGIQYTGNYYYVDRNGSRFSDLVTSIHQATQTLDQLRYSGNCY